MALPATVAAAANALQQEVEDVCDRDVDRETVLTKQRLYVKIGQFLLDGSTRQVGHWWCTYPTLMTFMMRVLELYPEVESIRQFYDAMSEQLSRCRDCVDVYHSAMPSVRLELEQEFTSGSVQAYFQKIAQLDAERIQSTLSVKGHPTESEKMIKLKRTTALYEVLSYRRLWSDFRIVRVLAKWFASMPNVNTQMVDLEILRKCPGTYQLLVSPDSGVRSWATSVVHHLGSIDIADEDESRVRFLRVIDEWMYILESMSFNVSLLSLELHSTEDLPLFLQPTTCIKTPTNQTLWAALDTVLQQMDHVSLEVMLESFDNFPDLVFNYLHDADPSSTNQQITFVICKCYAALFRCLSHRFWQHTVHSPDTVLRMVLQHCETPSWRVYVTKQLIEVLPPLLASMRPVQSIEIAAKEKVETYMDCRRRLLDFLMTEEQRPEHLSGELMQVACSRAVSTIIADCYEPRLVSSSEKEGDDGDKVHQEGELPDVYLVEVPVSESAGWWPSADVRWMDHLFDVVINVQGVASLVDHAAATCATVLRKHLQLARDIVFSCIIAQTEGQPVLDIESLCRGQPIVTKLLKRLSAYEHVTCVPITIHAALFESIGGISDLLNVLDAQTKEAERLRDFQQQVLELYLELTTVYLKRMHSEVLEKGLVNPLRFPLVAQHITSCLLSSRNVVKDMIKAIVMHAATNKQGPSPAFVESFLILVHRNTEANVRGLLTMVQSLRLFHFSSAITLPTCSKLAFMWSRVFELLGKDMFPILQPQEKDTAGLHRLPTVLSDLLTVLLDDVYVHKRISPSDACMVHILNLLNNLYAFWVSMGDAAAWSKKNARWIAPLAECVRHGSDAQRRLGSTVLTRLTSALLKGGTTLDETHLQTLMRVHADASSYFRERNTDVATIVTRFRSLNKTNHFFRQRGTKTALKVEGNRSVPIAREKKPRQSTQVQMDVSGMASAQADVAAARRNQSFYAEETYHATERQEEEKKVQVEEDRPVFNVQQALDELSKTHRGHGPVRSRERRVEKEEEPQEEGDEASLASIYYKIKHTQHAVASCSTLPFYRQLLQQALPDLVSKVYLQESTDKELETPELTFGKSSEYVHAFLPLLLEEVADELYSGLRRCTRSSSGHVLQYESEKPREGMRCLSLSLVTIDSSLFQERGRGKKSAAKLFRNADVVHLRSIGSSSVELVGVVSISDAEREMRRSGRKTSDEDESVKILFLNEGEVDASMRDVPSFSSETLAPSAMGAMQWKAQTVCNLTTSAREYVALRSVDLLPQHLRTAILTPDAYKSIQSRLLRISEALDALRRQTDDDSINKLKKLLNKLDRMDVALTDLRSTSIGKAVNRLRKHSDKQVSSLADDLKTKWTALMTEVDALEKAPRYLEGRHWHALKKLYNQSQLQSIHSVLNDYQTGVSLLQGPPGTGKTKTIMGLLSGFLALRLTPSALLPTRAGRKEENSDVKKSAKVSTPTTFSMGSDSKGGILRRSEVDATRKSTSIQSLKNASNGRGRLENKLVGKSVSSVQKQIKRPLVSIKRTSNVLLCAPSNGAVDELVLRIVTDGLLGPDGDIQPVRAPNVHPENVSVGQLSIVRLGNAGEDAPESIKQVCLPHIVKQNLEVHPKKLQLQQLEEQRVQFQKAIKDFHNDKSDTKKPRKELAKTHAKLTECSGKIRRLRDEVRQLESKLTTSILNQASVIACTLSKAGSGPLASLTRGFDALIIDEAAQAVELSTLVPIRERVARVVLVGDPKQLPATVKSVVAARARYDRSLFERVAASGVAPAMLRVQYRMHPFLREFPSKAFYGGLLTDGESVMPRVKASCMEVYSNICFQPFLLYDVESREEDQGGSKYNKTEAAFCVNMLHTMVAQVPAVRKMKWSVGIVSPYKEQVRVLRKELTRLTLPTSVSVEVNTVDGFQGREKDVIIFSCVRASKRGGVGFLKDIRRLNVAITRARFCLFVVGNVNTLMRDKTWASLVRSAKDRKLVIRAGERSFEKVKERMDGQDGQELKKHFDDMHTKINEKHASPSVKKEEDSDMKRKADPMDGKPSKVRKEVKEPVVKQEVKEEVKREVKQESQSRMEKDFCQDSTMQERRKASVDDDHKTARVARMRALAADSVARSARQYRHDRSQLAAAASQPSKRKQEKRPVVKKDSGNVLSNILGSASSLATSTSRAQEKTKYNKDY